MLKSMTGYGRAEEILDGRHVIFEIKSVNHKYFEFNPRLPRGYQFLEDRLKQYLQGQISRGKVDVYLQIDTLDQADVTVLVNHSLAGAYVAALRELQEHYHLTDGVSLSLLARYPDLLTVHKAPENEDAVWETVRKAVQPALDSFLAMRETEGDRLRQDLLEKADRVEAMVAQVESLTPKTVADYQERLKGKIRELLEDKSLDEQRLLTEVAIFADKVAVDEEIVRLRSHLKQFRSLVDQPEPVGRKIDFLIQEMNREVNTIGSKSVNSDIAYLVVDMKAEIEKIREQIQNVE